LIKTIFSDTPPFKVVGWVERSETRRALHMSSLAGFATLYLGGPTHPTIPQMHLFELLSN
jgi:hypothetical protein